MHKKFLTEDQYNSELKDLVEQLAEKLMASKTPFFLMIPSGTTEDGNQISFVAAYFEEEDIKDLPTTFLGAMKLFDLNPDMATSTALDVLGKEYLKHIYYSMCAEVDIMESVNKLPA